MVEVPHFQQVQQAIYCDDIVDYIEEEHRSLKVGLGSMGRLRLRVDVHHVVYYAIPYLGIYNKQRRT